MHRMRLSAHKNVVIDKIRLPVVADPDNPDQSYINESNGASVSSFDIQSSAIMMVTGGAAD